MRARPSDVPLPDLEALDWRTDPAYMELATRRDSMAHRRRELPEAIAEAECQAHEAAERHEEQALLALVQRGDARLQAQTKARVDSTTEAVRHLKAELLIVNDEYPRLERAAALIAKEARQRCQSQLQRLYTEAAAELAEMLPQVVAIHRKAGQLFPPIGRPRPEAADSLPSYAGLPNLSLAELQHTPYADGGETRPIRTHPGQLSRGPSWQGDRRMTAIQPCAGCAGFPA